MTVFFFFLPDDESFFSINPHCISYSFFIFQCFLPVIYLRVCKSSLVNLYLSQFPLAIRSPAETFFLWTERSPESTKTKQKRSYIGNIQILPGSGNNGRSSLQSSCSSTTRYNWKSRNAVK